MSINDITKSKWQLRLAAVVIFLLGMAAGALAPRAYDVWFETDRQSRQDRFGRVIDRLQLSAEQQTQVRQIFDETRRRLYALRRESDPRVNEIRRQADERLQQVLTPEQWQQFQQIMDEGRSSRRRGRNERSSEPRTPGDR